MIKKIIILLLFFSSTCYSEQQPVIFSTWEGVEADKLASIWLIKRFISPGAKIIIHPKGEIPDEGIQFDTPYSKIRRRYNQSTFDALLHYYHVSDPKLFHIAALINDIEINVWEEKKFQKTEEINFFFTNLAQDKPQSKNLIQKAGIFMDQLYNSLKQQQAK